MPKELYAGFCGPTFWCAYCTLETVAALPVQSSPVYIEMPMVARSRGAMAALRAVVASRAAERTAEKTDVESILRRRGKGE